MVDKIKNNKGLKFLFNAIGTALAGIIIWPLLDFILCSWITKTTFVYSVHEHIIQPIIFGFIVSFIVDIFFISKKD